jgi:hypothetical protein
MTRHPVVSSSLAAIGYNATARLLEVQFRNGRVYEYLQVDAQAHHALVTAESIGTYFNQHVREHHEFRRIE